MLLKKIKLENIRSYENEEIEFPEGNTLLSGNIGSGKSTILQAVDFALFGISQELTGSSLLRNGEDRGSVELHFNIESKKIIIKRTLKRGTSVTQDAGYISIDNARRDATATELKQSILTLLNYPEELLAKSKSLIYRYTVYTPQEEMKSILHGDKDYRLDTLRKVFGIDKYKRLKENAELVISDIKGKNKENAIVIADLEGKKTEKERKKQQLKEIKSKGEQLLPKLTEYHLVIEERKKQVEQKEKEIKKYREELIKKMTLETSLKHKQEERERNKKRIEEMTREVTKKEEELVKETPSTPNKGEALEKEKTVQKIESSIREAFMRIQERKTLSVHAEKIMVEIMKLDNCPICKQKVTPDHQKTVMEEEQGKKERYQEEIKRIQEEVNKLEEELRKEKKIVEELKKAEQVSALHSFKQKSIEEKKREIIVLQQAEITAEKEAGRVYADLQKIKEQIGVPPDEESYKTIRKEIEEIQEMKKQVEIEKATNEREGAHLEKEINTLDTEIKKKEKIRENIGFLKEIQFWLENMFINLMATMEKKIMLKVHADFDAFFRKWFETLVDTEAIKVSLDDEFSPMIEQNGHEINYNYLSGGEKTAAALAYRLALNQVINTVMSIIRTKDLIILDEPTDGFSAEQIDRLRAILEELKTKQIIIVSHENKIESFVEHVIKIEKKDHRSSVIMR